MESVKYRHLMDLHKIEHMDATEKRRKLFCEIDKFTVKLNNLEKTSN